MDHGSKTLLVLIAILVGNGCGAPSMESEVSAERQALAASSGLAQPVTETSLLSCEPMAGMTAYCGFKNPEDLVLVPGTNRLLVSEMGEFMMDTPGALSQLDLETGNRLSLDIDWAKNTVAGDANCAAPDVAAFSPHGIDLVTLDSGEDRLLVVNHGGRESVEFFSVAVDAGAPSLTWLGCALPPEDAFINDVAARTDGGFYVTHMWSKTGEFEEIANMLMSGQPTGWVWGWSLDAGFTKVAESDDLMPNGIAISPDNTKIYMNVYMGNRTVKLDAATGKREGAFVVRQPDNITVTSDGTLWVASHQHDPIGQTCAQVLEGPCLLPFQVIKANPDTMQSEVVIDHSGAPMGYSTVALIVDGKIFMGTAHGDRVVSVPLP